MRQRRRLHRLFGFLTCLGLLGAGCMSASLQAQAQKAPSPPSKRTLTVTMRDGTPLATDVYLPEGQGPFPVVFVRTPYNKDGVAGFARDGVQRGYAVVAQDTRGRYGSQGENLPFEADGWWDGKQDGADSIAWIAQQNWCNGKIGTWGGSAVGITQLTLAGTGTPYLGCQYIIVAAPGMYHHGTFPGGVFKKAMIEDWVRVVQFQPGALQRWTDHPTYDSYWAERDLERRWSKVNVPAVHVGGWYDIFAQGTIDCFLGYQTKGGPKARGQQKLVMGPWTHGVLQEKAGALTFPNAKRTPGGLEDAWLWFDLHLKGIPNKIAEIPPVTYYVMGDTRAPNAPGNLWRTAQTWPPFPTTPMPFYLRGDRTLSPARPDASLDVCTYTYDPQNPAPTVGGPHLTLPAGAMEQSKLESRSDVVSFTTPPLEKPLEVTGRVRMHLWASSDTPDTDFFVKLCDVYPDGKAYNICEGQLRARFRDGFRREKLLKPGQPTRFTIDMWSTSMIFNKGHRLRVLITSSNVPGYDPNPNTGDRFRANARTRPAQITIFADSRRASFIELPIPKEQ